MRNGGEGQFLIRNLRNYRTRHHHFQWELQKATRMAKVALGHRLIFYKCVSNHFNVVLMKLVLDNFQFFFSCIFFLYSYFIFIFREDSSAANRLRAVCLLSECQLHGSIWFKTWCNILSYGAFLLSTCGCHNCSSNTGYSDSWILHGHLPSRFYNQLFNNGTIWLHLPSNTTCSLFLILLNHSYIEII